MNDHARRFFLLLLAAALAALLAGPVPCRAAPLTVLHTFGPGGLNDLSPADHKNADGARPDAPLMQGLDGALYGTTPSGGPNGTGVVFKVNPDGTGFALLHSFGPLDALFVNAANRDGAWPGGALVRAAGGALYGTATQGGPHGSGTVFTLKPDGTGFKVLHAFGAKGELYANGDGASPEGLTLGGDGLLYGAALLGGRDGKGLLFRLNPDGAGFQALHVFRGLISGGNTNDGGALPTATPVFGHDGALYGTTNVGGKSGYGVLYRLTADGARFTVLHHFQRKGPGFEANGVFPEGPLTPSPDGFLYGSTRQGGADDSGTLFRMSQDGTGFTLLHTFSRSGDDGWLPGAAPLLGRDGRLYGVASGGGANGVGSLYWASVDRTKFVVLHDLTAPDGANPRAGLLQGRDGALYGVAEGGAPGGNGTVFRLVPPQAR